MATLNEIINNRKEKINYIQSFGGKAILSKQKELILLKRLY